MAASLFYIFNELQSNISTNALTRKTPSLTDALGLTLGCLGTLLLSTLYHVQIMKNIRRSKVHGLLLANAYSLGQIVRYLPGKVFGILFHVSMLKSQSSARDVVTALSIQTVSDYIWAAFYCGSLAIYLQYGDIAFLLVVVVSLLAAQVYHGENFVQRAVLRVISMFGGANSTELSHKLPRSKAVAMTAVLALVWVPLTLGFIFGYRDSFTAEESVIVAICYIAAAMFSLFAFVVPSGIGIREALLIWLGGNFYIDSADLAYVAVTARLALTAAEVGNALVIHFIKRLDEMNWKW